MFISPEKLSTRGNGSDGAVIATAGELDVVVVVANEVVAVDTVLDDIGVDGGKVGETEDDVSRR